MLVFGYRLLELQHVYNVSLCTLLQIPIADMIQFFFELSIMGNCLSALRCKECYAHFSAINLRNIFDPIIQPDIAGLLKKFCVCTVTYAVLKLV